jgi:hypothetical protein
MLAHGIRPSLAHGIRRRLRKPAQAPGVDHGSDGELVAEESIPHGERRDRPVSEVSMVERHPRRCITGAPIAWSRGRTTISSTLTCGGRVTAHRTQSAMSSPRSGVMPS